MTALALIAPSSGPSAPAVAAAAGPGLDRAERSVVRAVNRARRARGLRRVRAARGLTRAADAHSRDMLRADFFAHHSSDGRSMWARVSRYRPARRIGETLAYMPRGNRRRAARRVVRAWLRSPAHRAVLLTPEFRRIGIGRRSGRLGSARVRVLTADFASRR